MDADFLLLRRMLDGDDQAIEAFVRKYYPKILQYCRLHIFDRGYAEDCTQETFARFFRTLPQYRHYGKVIVACHGMMIQATTGKPDDGRKWPDNGEIIEFEL